MKTIPYLVESKNGHDTIDVPEDKIQEQAEKQLKEDKLVTLEKENGDTEILTESDMPRQTEIPTEEEQEDNENWAEKFEKTKSATVINKTKGF